MKQDTQIRILKEPLERVADKSNHDAGCQVLNPVSSYTSPELARHEWQAFFREHAQIVGMSGDLPKSGSYFALDDFGVPVLATRTADGGFRAFVNACRHRGTQLAPTGRGTARRFVCPFHGWTYTTGGELAAVTEPDQFGAVDRACLGLLELPAVEQFGFLWVHPRPQGHIDVPELLGGLADELESWNVAGHEFAGERRLDKRMNWKPANDTFGETYHFKRLHRDTLGQLSHGDVIAYETFGRNHRAVFPSKSIAKLHDKPEGRWRIGGVTTVLYYVFPNIEITISDRQVTLFRIYPDGENPGRSVTHMSHYFSAEALASIAAGEKTIIDDANAYDPSARDGNAIISPQAAMEILNSTVEHEDFRMGEAAQRSAESGLIEHFIFGRNEAPLHHFHSTFRAALGMSPLERIDAI